MKILALDPGAERMGWAILEDDVRWIDSGVWTCKRGLEEKFQIYKMRLIPFILRSVSDVIFGYDDIEELVSEIVPAVGGGNFVVATQNYLAQTAVTVAQTVALQTSIPAYQVGATTIKKEIGGKKDATKVRVRNGVYHFFPFLEELRGEVWKHGNNGKPMFDEPDAIAAGLTHLGYSIPQ